MEKSCSIDGCERPHGAKGFCYRHYSALRNHGDPLWVPPTREERFWAKVQKTDTCWLWTGKLVDGYGTFWMGKISMTSQRAAYEILVGPVPKDLHIDHLCHKWDTTCLGGRSCPHRRCVNPGHLEAVTRSANNTGRIVPHKTTCPRGHQYNANGEPRKDKQICLLCLKIRRNEKKELV